MFRRAAWIAAVSSLLSVFCMGAWVGRQPATEALFSKNQQEQRLALGAIRREHVENVQSLIKLVGLKEADDSWQGVRHLAILLLGDMRATEAVPALAERLTYLPDLPAYTTERLNREAYYPCATALVKIGQPCVGAMMGKIEWSKDKAVRELAAWVLMEVEGKERAAERLQSMADKSYDAKVKPRLQEAHDFIVDYKPVFSPPGVEPKPVELLPRPDSATRK